ncbi:MAG: hypothetical protein ABFD69_10795 [Candidatus Sumerlaeia bacterium]
MLEDAGGRDYICAMQPRTDVKPGLEQELTLTIRGTVVLKATVVDENQKPVSGFQASIYDGAALIPMAQVDGNQLMAHVPAGIARVVLTKAGKTIYDGKIDVNGQAEVFTTTVTATPSGSPTANRPG